MPAGEILTMGCSKDSQDVGVARDWFWDGGVNRRVIK